MPIDGEFFFCGEYKHQQELPCQPQFPPSASLLHMDGLQIHQQM